MLKDGILVAEQFMTKLLQWSHDQQHSIWATGLDKGSKRPNPISWWIILQWSHDQQHSIWATGLDKGSKRPNPINWWIILQWSHDQQHSIWATGQDKGIREAQSNQLVDHIPPLHLYDYPDCLLQIALVTNKYPTLFILKVLERNAWSLIALR